MEIVNQKCGVKCDDTNCANCKINHVMTLFENKLNDAVFISDEYFFEKDGKLYATVWNNDHYDDIECNTDSPMYSDKLDICIKRKYRYNECTCSDKDMTNRIPYCKKYGCISFVCYVKMKKNKMSISY